MANMLERNKNVKAPKKTYAEHAQDALYREVWEEVSNEKTLKFVKKYSKHILSAALAILIIATGFQIGMRTYRAKKVATAIAYETAIANADANALAALSDNTSGATADLALFQSYLLDNDIEKLKQLATDGNTRDFRDLAKLHIVTLQGDEMSAEQVEEYLDGLDTKNSPFYYNARLIVAQKYLADGNRQQANKILDKIISDSDAPTAVSAMATSLR